MNDCATSPNNLRYEELVDIPKLQELLESYSRVTGIANGVANLEGKILAHAGRQSVCTNFHRTNSQTYQRCIESDMSLARSIKQGTTFAVHKCLNGLINAAAPIFVAGEHVGNVFSGHFLTAPPEVEFFRRQALQFGFDEESYLEAIGQIPVVPMERVEAATRLNAQLASMMATGTGELATNEKRLRLALGAARQVVFDVDIQTGEVTVTPEHPELLGYDLAEFQASLQGFLDDIHSDDRPSVMAAFQAALTTNESTEASYRRQTKSGDWMWMNSVAKAIEWDSDGKPLRMIGVHTDITERKQIETQLSDNESRMRLALGAACQAIFDLDLRTGEVTVSAEYPQLLGYDLNEFQTDFQNWQDNIHPDDLPAVMATFKTALTTDETVEMSYRRQKKSGDWMWMSSVGKIVERDSKEKPLRMIGVHTDITAHKAAEAELNQYQHHLEHLVEERTTALSIAKEVAEAASSAKSVFLANMSHELRTPMNHIMGMTELARWKATDPEQIKHLSKVTQASNKLLTIINDILDISKIEAEQLGLERIDFTLDHVVDNLTDLNLQEAQKKGLRLDIEIEPELAQLPLQGDALRLGQILLNLTSNAIKFTEKGSVTLRLFVAEETAETICLRVEVTDTGIGISAGDQKRLFNAFEQADGSMTRKYGGTGLGLVISKRLARAMGGDIGVDSQIGTGSTFWFTAQLSRCDGDMLKAPEPDSSMADEQLKVHYSGLRILLAEDEPINGEIVKMMLEKAGLVVDLAEDGVPAVEMSKQTDYALILMDMRMPTLNGVDATKMIRALPGRERTPIVAMTANAFTDDRMLCMNAGMNDFLSKPFRPQDMYAMTLKWLAQGSR